MTAHIEKPVRTAPRLFMNGERTLDVLMIGAGGNGSELFDSLVKLHHALVTLGGKGLNITLMDDDTVSESNVVRQRFWPHEAGQNKAIALVHRANLMMGTGWTALPERFTERTVLNRRPDLVITAVDNLAARRTVNSYFTATAHPALDAVGRPTTRQNSIETFWLDLGCTKDKAQMVLGRFSNTRLTDEWPNVMAHFPDVATREDDDNEPSCSAAESLARQDLMINQAVANAATNLLWKVMREGKARFNGTMIDLSTGYSQGIPFMPIGTTEH